MTYREAFALAEQIIETMPDVRVVAIGRFLPVHLIRDSDPWKISVVAGEKTYVIDSPEALDREVKAFSQLELF